MYFELYDNISGDLIGITDNFNFGDIIHNQHCVRPLVFRAFSDIENSINNFRLFLENKGSINAEYGYYISPIFEPFIKSGSNKLSNHFTEVPDASSTSPGSVSIGWDTTSSYWVWLDSNISAGSGISEPNFRFFYDWT